MANENETGVSREDAQNTAESLFGDTIAEQSVAIAVEEDGKNETGQDSQGLEIAEGEAAGDETSPQENLKVVVSIEDGRATIGVQQPSSDPYIELVDTPDLSGVTREVLAVVERARARWEDEPKYPAHARPTPSTRGRGRREQSSAKDSTAEGDAAQPQPETLKLF